MNVLPQAKREQILRLLVEGNSLRGTARVAEVSYNAVLQFLPKIGSACDRFHNDNFRHLTCRELQIDEIWSFCHTKQKNVVGDGEDNGRGDIWTFVAIDPMTKLVPTWLSGKRTLESARLFIRDLHGRLASLPQISTDGYRGYQQAIYENFGPGVDYGMLIKVYENNTDPETVKLHDDIAIKSHVISGKPNIGHISTTYIEKQNQTMRQSMRRFTRKTNGHSKKFENHCHALALHFFHYNMCRVHQTLKTTPAMAAELTDHVWSIGELLSLMD